MSRNQRFITPEIFGNSAAEDEEDDVFASYVLDRPELSDFLSRTRRICIARAYKGEGKSALLRLVDLRLSESADSSTLFVRTTANELDPRPKTAVHDPNEWCHLWKLSLLRRCAILLGKEVSVALTDDAMHLVEQAEASGQRQRTVIKGLTTRLGSSKLEFSDAPSADAALEGMIERELGDSSKRIWLIVDDIDTNFTPSADGIAKVTGFFMAARLLSQRLKALRFRLAVRPNVWSILRRENEDLSKVEQYCTDLRWSQEQLGEILRLRIASHIERIGDSEKISELNATRCGLPSIKKAVSYVFESPMKWGAKQVSPFKVISTLSALRPRWMVELCRQVAKRVPSGTDGRLNDQDIFAEVKTFGERRIADTVSEYKCQCEQLEDLIYAFRDGPAKYTHSELEARLSSKAIGGLRPQISGVPGSAGWLDVANLLFQIGLYYARRDYELEQTDITQYEHITYPEDPHLLRSSTQLDPTVRWEIHPVYRQALRIRDEQGKVAGPTPDRRRKPRVNKGKKNSRSRRR